MPAQPRARIFLGVCGSIAAYKSIYLARLLVKNNYEVRVGFTQCASRFVTEESFRIFTNHAVLTSSFGALSHIDIARWADIILVAPATAHILSTVRAGLAGDVISQTILSTTAPVVFVPAMHTAMWENPAVRENVSCLAQRGYRILGPAKGDLTGGDWGAGRMVEPPDIVEYISCNFASHNSKNNIDPEGGIYVASNHSTTDLSGKKFLITAGGTRQAIDPVRYIGNRSSGKQAIAIAREAQKRSAEVVLISANVEKHLLPESMRIVEVNTPGEMQTAVLDNLDKSHAILMAAAISDFKPQEIANEKIKSDNSLVLNLTPATDLLRLICRHRSRMDESGIVIGFSADTCDSANRRVELARKKLLSKGCDYMVVNQVGTDLGFEIDSNEIILIDSERAFFEARGSKDYVAVRILDFICERLKASEGYSPGSPPAHATDGRSDAPEFAGGRG